MNDFRLRPSPRSAASGNDFRLIPGWDGDEAVANVGGSALVAHPITSGDVSFVQQLSVGGSSLSPNAFAWCDVETDRRDTTGDAIWHLNFSKLASGTLDFNGSKAPIHPTTTFIVPTLPLDFVAHDVQHNIISFDFEIIRLPFVIRGKTQSRFYVNVPVTPLSITSHEFNYRSNIVQVPSSALPFIQKDVTYAPTVMKASSGRLILDFSTPAMGILDFRHRNAPDHFFSIYNVPECSLLLNTYSVQINQLYCESIELPLIAQEPLPRFTFRVPESSFSFTTNDAAYRYNATRVTLSSFSFVVNSGIDTVGARSFISMNVENSILFELTQNNPTYKTLRLHQCPLASLSFTEPAPVSGVLRILAEGNPLTLDLNEVSFNTKFLKLFMVRFQQRNEHLMTLGYSLNNEIRSISRHGYLLLDYNNVQSVFNTSYQDQLEKVIDVSYADNGVLNKIVSVNYDDCARSLSNFNLGYSDHSSLSAIHESVYSDYSSLSAVKELSYSNYSAIQYLSENKYNDCSENRVLTTLGYHDCSNNQLLFNTSYSDCTKFSYVVNQDYGDHSSLSNIISMSFSDRVLIAYCFDGRYQDRDSVSNLIHFDYQSYDLETTCSLGYSLLSELSTTYSSSYKGEMDRLSSMIHMGYSLNEEETVLLSGSCSVEIEGQWVDIHEVSINSDESSPYYQCSLSLKQESDYTKFGIDKPFIVHLFSNHYSFVVDKRSLNRSIDNEGHLQCDMVIEGLSPIVRYGAPRARAITKTWEQPIALSDFITELIGAVTWTGVDDWIPGYLLAAENSIPLELARTVLESIGSLIQSQPDGQILIRPLWPVSVPDLNTVLPDRTLNDDLIFSMSEGSENQDLRNRFRILDHDVTHKDQLEFVMDEDDPLSGILYGYPSPWRDDLSFRHTRGAPIYLMPHTTEIYEPTINEDGEIEPDIIEFSNGKASVRYPIASILHFEWLEDSLGGVSFTPYSNEITASIAGYSLGQIRYTTRRMKARTGSKMYTTAQYLMEEEES